MAKNAIQSGRHEFELVDYVPYGYVIWNIGRNMVDGYLPLVQLGGRDGCQVINTSAMKAIKVDGAQIILAAVGYGVYTVDEMERYIQRYSKNKNRALSVERMKKALPIMRQIKGL